MKTIMQNNRRLMRPLWLGLFLGALIYLGSISVFADLALRYERTSNRIERRDVRSTNRIERRDERSTNRIDRRDERITNRIERRDYILSPPVGATRVAVGGANYFKAGADYYQPEFYEGKTVFVKVDLP